MTKTSRVVECAECWALLPESAGIAENPPCPKCGSTQRHIKLHIKETLEIYDQIRSKLRKKRKEKTNSWIYNWRWLKKNSGKWHDKQRRIDRESNLYKEVIKDKITGEIIHECEEPLNEHYRHGSAKFKENNQKKKNI